MLAACQDLLDFTHAARGPWPLRCCLDRASLAARSNLARGQLPEETGAETLGVVVDPDLQIESESTALGARRLSVGESVLVSGRMAAFLYDLQVRHRAHEILR